MFDWLLSLDHKLFTFLNSLNVGWMDTVQYWISNKYIWIPLYVLLLIFIILHYKKKSIVIVLMMVGLITVCDQSSQFFKYGVGRYRPCRTESAHQPKPHLVNDHCGGKYGFYSAHASNSFAIALFIGYLLTPFARNSKKYLLVWAAVVAYSRVYLGVHYPSDIIVGSFMGLLYGWLFYKGFTFFNLKLMQSNSEG
ncbi:MAG: phosphatase PAP2 family protein [Flavobacteriales bacterium]|nr:phosphatase PAP2 family protein [Flavobacteriales bacterium]